MSCSWWMLLRQQEEQKCTFKEHMVCGHWWSEWEHDSSLPGKKLWLILGGPVSCHDISFLINTCISHKIPTLEHLFFVVLAFLLFLLEFKTKLISECYFFPSVEGVPTQPEIRNDLSVSHLNWQHPVIFIRLLTVEWHKTYELKCVLKQACQESL